MTAPLADLVVDFTRVVLAALAVQQTEAGVHRGDDLDRAERVELAAAARSLRSIQSLGRSETIEAQWEDLLAVDGATLLTLLGLDDAERLVVIVTAALEIEPRLGPIVACLTDQPALRHATVTLLDDAGRLLGWPRHAVRRTLSDDGTLTKLRLVARSPGPSSSFGDSVVVPDEWLLAGVVDGGVTGRPIDRRLYWQLGKPDATGPRPVGPLLCTDPDPASDAAAWAEEDGLAAIAVVALDDGPDDGEWDRLDVVVAAARQCLAEGSGLLVRTGAHRRHTRSSCETIAGCGVSIALHDPLAERFPLPDGWRRLAARRPAQLRVTGDRDVAWSELSRLAARIDTSVGWGDLVVAPRTERHLRDVAAAIANHATVMETWGFCRRPGAVGISVLCNGPSGTGKTLACRVLAAESGLDLWMVDLARVTDKYLGESEKHLDRVLTAAAASGAMLLFDEAEALFGRRGETHEARDRWANLEVAYLLQRIERHPGVTVLTTNLAQQLDDAFDRRIAHRVEFVVPDARLRARLWREMFAPEAPLADPADLRLLAERFELSGGSIRSAAVNAAYAAAADGAPITLAHLVRATVRELAKSGGPPTRAELGDLATLLDEPAP